MNFTASTMPGVFATPASIPAPVGPSGTLGTFEYDITIVGGSQKVIVPVTTIVTTSAQVPPFMGSVVNAASQTAGSVAPGEILTIFGFGAGPSNTAGFTLDPSGKVANSLNGAQVLFDGRPAPMIYGSASQVNVIVPYEVAGQATTTVALKFGAQVGGMGDSSRRDGAGDFHARLVRHRPGGGVESGQLGERPIPSRGARQHHPDLCHRRRPDRATRRDGRYHR